MSLMADGTILFLRRRPHQLPFTFPSDILSALEDIQASVLHHATIMIMMP